ncbi:FKBP-type peptidyl-prolyl cis-trans isomerase [Nocardioides sp.]|uniref:FKBP-type peptidyl-prolyl cis-trans isomerase n=1 Tax=Nocardioides sp. TaxID=35761 RepID=UPI003517D0E9
MASSPKVRRTALIAGTTLALSLALAACGSEDDDATATDTPSASADAGDTGDSGDTGSGDSALPEWAPQVLTDADDVVTGFDFTDTPEPGDALEVAVLREGDGAVVESGQTIQVYYLGQTYDGGEPFDGNYGSGSPIGFPIGVGAVIQGWDQALVGQTIGSRVLMSIPSDLGYGDAGSPPVIPGGATLYFVVDIVDAA